METEKEKSIENGIIVGIAQTLFRTFGSECRVYAENVKQGFTEPCFTIEHLLTINEPKIPVRYLRRYSFNVHYFPSASNINCESDDSNRPNREMHHVAQQLFLILEYIYVLDNLVKASKMSYEIQEGHLHFFVDYNIFVKKQKEAGELMETLIHKKVEE